QDDAARSCRTRDAPYLRIGTVPEAEHARAVHEIMPGVVYGDLNRRRPSVAAAGGDAIEVAHVEVRRVHGDGDCARVVARIVVGQLLRRRQDVPVGRNAGSVPVECARRARTRGEPGDRLRTERYVAVRAVGELDVEV